MNQLFLIKKISLKLKQELDLLFEGRDRINKIKSYQSSFIEVLENSEDKFKSLVKQMSTIGNWEIINRSSKVMQMAEKIKNTKISNDDLSIVADEKTKAILASGSIIDALKELFKNIDLSPFLRSPQEYVNIVFEGLDKKASEDNSDELSIISALYQYAPFKILPRKDQDGELSFLTTFCSIRFGKDSHKRTTLHRDLTTSTASKLVKESIIPKKKIRISIGKHKISLIIPREIKVYNITKLFKSATNSAVIISGDYRSDRYQYPIHIEISEESIIKPKYCMFGYVIASSRDYCPIKRYCEYYRRNKCNGKKYYRNSWVSLTRLYYFYPLIRKRFSFIESSFDYTDTFIDSMGKKIIRIGKIKDGLIARYIDGIAFIPRMSSIFMFRNPVIYFKDKIGELISDIKGVFLEFDKDILRQVIKNVLINDSEVLLWIYIKYASIKRTIKFEEFSDFPPQNAINLLKMIANGNLQINLNTQSEQLLITYKINGRTEKIPIKLYDIIDFAVDVFVHSLLHLLIVYISDALQVSFDDYFIGVIDKESFNDSIIICVLENIPGGYGIIDTLDINLHFIINFFKSSRQLLNKIFALEVHKLTTLKQKINQLKSKGKLEKAVGEAFEKYTVDMYNKHKIFASLTILRDLIFKELEDISDEQKFRDLVTNLVGFAPTTFDASNLDLIIDRGCIDHPLRQLFSLSNRLTAKILEQYDTIFSKSPHIKPIDLLRPRDRDYFVNFIRNILQSSKKRMYITTAFLTEYFVEQILKPVFWEISKKGYDLAEMDIKIMIKDPTDISSNDMKERQIRGIRALVDLLRAYGLNPVEIIRFNKKLHAKFILIDDIIVLSGSFNLTHNAMNWNIELLSTLTGKESAKQLKNEFLEIWEKSIPLNEYLLNP